MKRVCLLTGAGGRLGRMFCARYADRYAIVAAVRNRRHDSADQDEEHIDPTQPIQPRIDSPDRSGKGVYTVEADIDEPADRLRLVEVALARHDRIDLVVHAAVRYELSPMLGSQRAIKTMEAVFQTNVIAPSRLTALIADRFWETRYHENRAHNRNVVFISSTSSMNVYGGGQGVYSATKAAVNMLGRHFAAELRVFGVRANVTAPTAFPRLVSTEAVAESIVTLDEGSMNGGIWVLDENGGRLI